MPAMAFGFTSVRQNGFQINSCDDSMTIREGSSSGRETPTTANELPAQRHVENASKFKRT
jgi:hypothetical protein